MERRNEYEINSIPASAAWRNSMHLYALTGKLLLFRRFFSSLRIPSFLPIFLASFVFFTIPLLLLPRYIFLSDFFTRLVAQFRPCRISSTTMDNEQRKVG